jgi:hypothetical protein
MPKTRQQGKQGLVQWSPSYAPNFRHGCGSLLLWSACVAWTMQFFYGLSSVFAHDMPVLAS